MQRYFFIFFTIFLGNIIVFSQSVNMQLFAEYSFTSSQSPLVYSSSVYTGVSPRAPSFYNGRTVFIPQLLEGLLFDLISKKFIGSLNYYKPDPQAFYQDAAFFSFMPKFVFVHNNFLVVGLYDMSTASIRTVLEDSTKTILPNANSVYINGYLFFYNKKNELLAISKDGNLINTSQVIAMLQEWHNATWYDSISDKEKHAKLISTGMYLIVDGIFYPSIASQANDYFLAMNYDWQVDNEYYSYRIGSNGFMIGLNGELFFEYPEGLAVFNQFGQEIALINLRSTNMLDAAFSRGDYNVAIGGYYSVVNTNSDIYALQAVKNDKLYFYKATRAWGTDYIALARTGCTAATEAVTRRRIQSFNNPELRILRNALFVQYGYEPLDWQMKNYFLGYEWYIPNPTIRQDPNILSIDQKRLLSMVQAEEIRRGWHD